MNVAGLSFDQIPPLKIPFRFYAGAAAFAFIAGVLMIINQLAPQGQGLWFSRWQPQLIALVHLFTLGVMGQVMLGSLFQLMPVLAGAPIRLAERLALPIQLLMVVGVSLLSWALYFQSAEFYPYAGGLIFAGLLLFLSSMLQFLPQIKTLSQSLFGISMAAICLLLTLLSGLALLGVLAGWWGLDLARWTNNHAIIGLFGWAGLLVTVVSFQVIPMFHVTADFPAIWKRLSPLLILILIIASCLVGGWFRQLLLSGVLGLLIAQAALSIRLLLITRRRLTDATRRFWLVSWSSLITGSFVLFVSGLQQYISLPLTLDSIQFSLLAGWLLLIGFFYSAILGMLLKIGPFLVFLRLQRRCMEDPLMMPRIMELPGFNEVLPKRNGRWLLLSQIALLLTGVVGMFWPPLMLLVGIIMATQAVWLLLAIVLPCWRFHQDWLTGKV
ncbi:hypothetical protein [Pelagibaculum spongiae]|uniref:Uncharacterized protein n=1 Tax=Pelagibaculum spongiae TaxID=2080658 RepID=A0A2V1GTQ2_9GAMM|nr:hypothetical protein [Pelagibaculum spongiae]PVZ68988.1 hypothetical protein DC094_12140 [Pelagibaculum spongiae]